MISATPSSSTSKVRPPRRPAGAPPRTEAVRSRRGRGAGAGRRPLVRYHAQDGRSREIVNRPGAHGTVLVLDRDAATLGDCRLVAHLGPEEPARNASLACREYLLALAEVRGGCRAVVAEDFTTLPYAALEPGAGADDDPRLVEVPVDRLGYRYRLEFVESGMSIPMLRWRRHQADGSGARTTVVSVREVVAALEDYAPVCEITEQALLRWRQDDLVSTVKLAAELERVRVSPIVLNRLLRTAVLSAIELQGLSMSALAIRCGRTKRDRGGTRSGETSWLARRIGLLPEGGQDAATPWIHSDVLALIARDGLGVSPREVELQ